MNDFQTAAEVHGMEVADAAMAGSVDTGVCDAIKCMLKVSCGCAKGKYGLLSFSELVEVSLTVEIVKEVSFRVREVICNCRNPNELARLGGVGSGSSKVGRQGKQGSGSNLASHVRLFSFKWTLHW